MNLIYLQIRKVLRRNDVLIAFSFFAVLPIIIAALIANESSIITIGESIFSGSAYMTVILGLLKSLFVVYIFICLFVTGSVAGEIDQGIDNMYYAKISKRSSIILGKEIALIMVGILILLIMMGFSAIGWEIFIKGGQFGTSQFLSEHVDENQICVAMIVLSFLEVIVFALAFSVICLFCTQGKSLVLCFLLTILFKILERVDKIKQFIPTYLGDAKGLYELAGKEFTTQALRDGALLFIYAVVLLVVVLQRYRKMDLVR